MPYSPDHRTAFVHIPKTGGSSVVQALASAGIRWEFSGNGLWSTLADLPQPGELTRDLRRSFGITELGTFPQQHLPAAALRTLLGGRTWNDSFTFAFVRNPWDLMVSSYFFFKQHAGQAAVAGQDADRVAMAQRCDTFERFVHLYPVMRSDSTHMLSGDDGESLVEFVGRYERLEQDFHYVCERLGVDAQLPHLRATEHAPYRDYYTSATREAVARHFERDIERFEYTF